MGKTRDLFKKIRDTKGTLHEKMGTIKDRNGMDLTEAEDIKKRWQEYIHKLHERELNDPDNHNNVITHIEPDILEWEVKWDLGSITMNKASEGDETSAQLFQILKDDAVEVLHSIYQQIWKAQCGHRAGKGQFSFQFQRKAMPKIVQTTAQLHSSVRKAERQNIDAFELWCWRRLLRVPWTARRSNQSILKEINPEYSLEGLKLKLQSFGHLRQRANSLEKTLIWEILRAWGKGDDRGWDGWMASWTQWTLVWANSGR